MKGGFICDKCKKVLPDVAHSTYTRYMAPFGIPLTRKLCWDCDQTFEEWLKR